MTASAGVALVYENIILVVIAAGVIIFGAKKLPELARSLGRAQADFEKARREARQEISAARSQDGTVSREKLEEIADSLGINYTNKNDEELRSAIDIELDKGRKARA
jgi:sec-independent protein translocase protein TatA